MKRYLLFCLLALVLTGCSSSQSKLLGTWEDVGSSEMFFMGLSFWPDGFAYAEGMDFDYTINGNNVILQLPKTSLSLTGTINGDTLILYKGTTTALTLTRLFSSSSQNKLLGTWKITEGMWKSPKGTSTITFLPNGRAFLGEMGTYTIQNNNYVIMRVNGDTSKLNFVINSDLLTIHPLEKGGESAAFINGNGGAYVRVK